MKYRVVLERDEETGDWAIWCPELPGCVSAGETEAEGRANFDEAMKLYFQRDPIEPGPDGIRRGIVVDEKSEGTGR
jgi:predicted RNase H-like HicB family nuclease